MSTESLSKSDYMSLLPRDILKLILGRCVQGDMTPKGYAKNIKTFKSLKLVARKYNEQLKACINENSNYVDSSDKLKTAWFLAGIPKRQQLADVTFVALLSQLIVQLRNEMLVSRRSLTTCIYPNAFYNARNISLDDLFSAKYSRRALSILIYKIETLGNGNDYQSLLPVLKVAARANYQDLSKYRFAITQWMVNAFMPPQWISA